MNSTTIKHYLSLIKFSHSIFALPFAAIGFVMGASQMSFYSFTLLLTKGLLILGCMLTARSAAMAFNRYLDADIDAQNPRTVIREIPSGIITAKNAFVFTLINCVAFIIFCFFINTLCFYLSFIALIVILGYSYTKRFTPLCHLVLGLGLSLSPIGAYLAVTGSFAVVPVLFSCVVLCWVSGFDIIYALQDESFDRNNNLKSIPVLLGTYNALIVARVLHTSAAIIITLIGVLYLPYRFYYVGTILFIVLLIRQHSIISATNLSKINIAFFTLNGIASIVFASFVILSLLMHI